MAKLVIFFGIAKFAALISVNCIDMNCGNVSTDGADMECIAVTA